MSLGLLLANDRFLKSSFPGWLTGKLSDFAGLIVLALVLFPLLPRRSTAIASGIAAFFIWWKSPYSSFAIDAVNGFGLVTIGRVVDYSDLLALVVLPVSVLAYRSSIGQRTDVEAWRRALIAPTAVVAVLAISGTSVLRSVRPAEIRADGGGSVMSVSEVDTVIESLFNSRNDECQERVGSRRACFIDRVWFSYEVNDDGLKFEFEELGNSRRRVNRLIDSLKQAFATRADGLIYVEPLVGPEYVPPR